MAERVNILELIKLDLESYVGKRVKLKANRGRRKVIEAEGVIENTYPKIFVVKLDKSHSVRRMSYTYADVLTKTVELTVDDNIIGDVEVANL
ncbi:MAG: Veg protein [Firmicutes bacterium]|nr:Veg protein [Bacillota bacterium]